MPYIYLLIYRLYEWADIRFVKAKNVYRKKSKLVMK